MAMEFNNKSQRFVEERPKRRVYFFTEWITTNRQ